MAATAHQNTLLEQARNIPVLRFPEFEGSWKPKKIREIAKIERGRFSPRPRNNPIYYNGKIPFVQTSDVVNSNGRIKRYSQTLNEKGLKVSKKFSKGTILITIAANIGYAGVLEIDMACPDSLIGITCKKETYNYFMNYLLEIEQPKMDYLAVAAAQKNINIEFLSPYTITFPSLPEQQKIASFLTAVDDKIQQLTKKKNLLEQYKKGVMQKIFKQEIRFENDEGNEFPEWEEKKLEEVVIISKGQQLNRDLLEDSGLYPALNGGVEPSGNTTKWNTKENTITISEGGNSCGYINFMNMKFWCGGHCYTVTIKNQSELKNEHLFQSLKYNEKDIMRLRVGSGLPNIQKKDILNFHISIPQKIEEQQKIADFLTAIDNKIELANTQLEKMKEFKKGLLQQMFI